MCAAEDLRTINTHSCPGSVTSFSACTHTYTHKHTQTPTSILTHNSNPYSSYSFITQKSHLCIECQLFYSSLTQKFHLFSCLLAESIFCLSPLPFTSFFFMTWDQQNKSKKELTCPHLSVKIYTILSPSLSSSPHAYLCLPSFCPGPNQGPNPHSSGR